MKIIEKYTDVNSIEFNRYFQTDEEWKGYLPLKKIYEKLEQVPSKKGKNFKQLHIYIMNIQGWLRGIHHHCSKEHLQGYLDEYHFRYNIRESMGVICNLLIKKMVLNEPKRLNNNKLT